MKREEFIIDIKAPKKLIEVALPLDEINAESVREKSIRHGHPSTLHLWWARRPLAAARAVLFAQLVNDPGYERSLGRGVNKEKAEAERKRLFGIMKKLVIWENINNDDVLTEARAEIQKSWRETCDLNRNHPHSKELFNPDKLPAFHDPFAGGGAIPLEAQRLGLKAWASDLNPVAVLINKAMIEIPPKFAGMPPVNPESRKQKRMGSGWKGAEGLAEDVRYYGKWMRDEAERRIGHLYPKVRITNQMSEERPDLKEYVGEELTVIAWIWARTVRSPNPAFKDVEVPLASTFWLSKKEGKEAYAIPIIEGPGYRFIVKTGKPLTTSQIDLGTKASGKGATFRCIISDTPIDGRYIKEEGQAGRMGAQLMAIVAEGRRERIYLSPTPDMEALAKQVQSTWKPQGSVPERLSGGTCYSYGLNDWGSLFTSRQLIALSTLSNLISEVVEQVHLDSHSAGMPDDGVNLEDDGKGATAYASSVAIYLGFIIDQVANHSSSLCGWNSVNTQMRSVFSRQAIPMVWDYAECNIFGNSSGSFNNLFERQLKGFSAIGYGPAGSATQKDARLKTEIKNCVISTDPPYYDNICYSDLSDFFYVWLRHALKPLLPSLFATILVPKEEELVALAYRHGSRERAETFFMCGMTEAIHHLMEQSHPAFPVTIYYAFKQSETEGEDTSSTGWESFLEAVIKAGFSVDGTWPLRTEKVGRSTGINTNALASSVVLVCRKRDSNAPVVSRKEFLRELKQTLPEALEEMTADAIAPVDLAQAAIGPGMGIFTQYSSVLEADGTRMSVHDALVLINRELDSYFSGASGDLDADSRFCIGWFEQMGWKEGRFGEADVLARARGTTVEGVREAGVLEAGGGRVRLLKWNEYSEEWNPEGDERMPVWEALHQLLRVHQTSGDSAAGTLLSHMSDRSMAIRQLAYRLYTLCERKGWADDARPYNELIVSWGVVEQMTTIAIEKMPQKRLDSFGK